MAALVCLLDTLLGVYGLILFVRAILSWVSMGGWSPPPALSPVIRVVYDLTEPPLSLLRRYVPPIGGGGMAIDTSFLVLILIIFFVRTALPC
ncbi:MAG: YggT family protein [Actinomycetota bacterium]